MNEEILQGILNSSPDAKLVRDQQGTILYRNDKFNKLWNLPYELYDEKNSWKIIEYVKEQLIDPTGFVKGIEDIINKAEQYQDYIYFKNGRIIERFFYPLNLGDNRQGIIWTFREVSNDEKIVHLLEKIKFKDDLLIQAKEIDKLKTDFFSSISHDLKTPLNTILGIGELVKKLHAEEDCPYKEKVSKYMDTSKKTIYKLLRLINNLIDINRVDIGQIHLDLKPYNLISVIEEITLSVAEYANAKGIELVFDTEIEEKIGFCDLEKIERVMLNLLSNGIKHTSSGGKITVHIYDRVEKIAVSVKDTGAGIPASMMDKIFERYVQVNSSQKIGSGIGLALVRSFIELHKGTITVNSEEGKGSEFIIEMPVNLEKVDDLAYEKVATDRTLNEQHRIMEIADIDAG